MKIVIAGGTGLIGEPLVRTLTSRGDDVAVLSRNPSRVRAGRGVAWSAAASEVAAADAIVNLAGENIGGGRWTAARKQKLIASRIEPTRALVDALPDDGKPRTFVNASAVGFYGDRGDEILDEGSPSGDGFLAQLVRDWEREASRAQERARTVIARFGVVLSKEGGALAKMLPPFKLGGGGVVGSGRQWMSWVDRDDVVGFLAWTLATRGAEGIYNVTSPQPVTNREFTKVLAAALHRPAIVPIPAFALRVAFGEMADETLLVSQRAVPKRAMAEGFVFRYAALDGCMMHALA